MKYILFLLIFLPGCSGSIETVLWHQPKIVGFYYDGDEFLNGVELSWLATMIEFEVIKYNFKEKRIHVVGIIKDRESHDALQYCMVSVGTFSDSLYSKIENNSNSKVKVFFTKYADEEGRFEVDCELRKNMFIVASFIGYYGNAYQLDNLIKVN